MPYPEYENLYILIVNGEARFASYYECALEALYADEATLEKARNVIKGRDGNLTGSEGNEVSGVTEVSQFPAPSTARKRPLAPAVKVVLERTGN